MEVHMTGKKVTATIAAAVAAGVLSFGCATAARLQNYDKVSLGMTADQVLTVAGKPNSKFKMESTAKA
jgi:hypothetical protein